MYTNLSILFPASYMHALASCLSSIDSGALVSITPHITHISVISLWTKQISDCWKSIWQSYNYK